MSQYYKKYMKKREEEKPSPAKLFIGVFMLMVAFCIIFATHAMISVDTTIGENDEGDIKESGLGVKHLIDSRLKLIQMEDTGSLSVRDEKEKNTIEVYDKTVETKPESAYSGQYQSSYGYNQTQQTKPYNQTYNNTQATTSAVKPATTATTAPVATPKPSAPTPSYQVQKNLAPTGVN